MLTSDYHFSQLRMHQPLLAVGLPPPTANGIPAARPPGPRTPAFGVRPPGAPGMGPPLLRPPQMGGAPPSGGFQPSQQPPGPGFAPQQQTLGRPGFTPPGIRLLPIPLHYSEHNLYSLACLVCFFVSDCPRNNFGGCVTVSGCMYERYSVSSTLLAVTLACIFLLPS